MLPPDSFQQFPIPAHLLDENNRLTITFGNPNDNDTSLMFSIEDGFELLFIMKTVSG